MPSHITTGQGLFRATFKQKARTESPASRNSHGLIVHNRPNSTVMRFLKQGQFRETISKNGNYIFSFNDGGGRKIMKEIIIEFNPRKSEIAITKKRPGYDATHADIHSISLAQNTSTEASNNIAGRIKNILRQNQVKRAA